MNYQTSHDGLINFQNCPIKYQKFEPTEESFISQTIKKCVSRIFLKEMELERIPNLRSLNTYWGKRLEELRQDGLRLVEVNNITLALRAFYEQYKRISYNGGLRTMAVWLPVNHVTTDMVYSAKIPIVLADKNGKIIPVFFTKPRSTIKDNRVRFASTVLSSKVDLEIVSYFNIKLSVSPANFTMERYNFNRGELARAESQLDSVLSLMGDGYSVPNTDHCTSCEFLNKCRL